MIRLVTDSNSQLPAVLRETYSVDVVPLTVTVDGQGYLEGEEIDLAGITAALERQATVGTSTPAPGQFLQAYERAAAQGASAIVSVHAGGGASGTANSARIAAAMAPVPVEVVDTGTASFPVSLCLWAAAEVLTGGGSTSAAAQAARDTAAVVDNVFIVGALGLAARGGRLAPGLETAGVPVLALTSGTMQAIGEVTDAEAAVEAMIERVASQTDGKRVRAGVGHLAAAGLADLLEAGLRQRVDLEQLVRYDVGPSVAVHVGLGTVGCVFYPL